MIKNKKIILNDNQVKYLKNVLNKYDDKVSKNIKIKLSDCDVYNSKANQKANKIEEMIKEYPKLEKFKRILYNSRHDFIDMLTEIVIGERKNGKQKN